MKKDFLTEINERVLFGAVTASDSRFENVGENEQVVGVCSRQIKILFSILEELEAKVEEYKSRIENLTEDSKSEERTRWNIKLTVLEWKVEILNTLIRVSVREDISELFSKRTAAIRKGWKIVYIDGVSSKDEFEFNLSAKIVGESDASGIEFFEN